MEHIVHENGVYEEFEEEVTGVEVRGEMVRKYMLRKETTFARRNNDMCGICPRKSTLGGSATQFSR